MILKLLSVFLAAALATPALGATRFYRLVWNGDPATTMTIGFDQYDEDGTGGTDPGNVFVYYGTIPQGQNQFNYPNSHAPDRVIYYKLMENNFVRLTGLQPNTRYYFVVADDQDVSAMMFFETMPDNNTTPLSIIAGGDSRDLPDILTGGVDDEWYRQNANKLVAKLRPHCVLFGGDMTLTDDEIPGLNFIDSEWVEWFDDWQLTKAADGRMTPVLVCQGNHELSPASLYNFFDTPSPDVYYAMNLGSDLVRAYTLNTEISVLGNQLTWLNNDLTNHCATWKIVQYHRPMRPHHSNKPDMNDLANNWAPLFETKDVQLVIECDAHLSKYTYPLRRTYHARQDEGFIRDDEQGVVYIGEGGWGAELRTADDNKGWTMASGSFNQINWIFAYPNRLEVRTVKTDNANDVVAKTDQDDRFTMPTNIDIWNPAVNRPARGIMTYNAGVMTIWNPTNCD